MSIPTKYFRAAHADPDDAQAWRELGAALVQQGDRVGALTALRNASLLDAGCLRTQRELGNLLFECGQLDHALACFERLAATRTK